MQEKLIYVMQSWFLRYINGHSSHSTWLNYGCKIECLQTINDLQHEIGNIKKEIIELKDISFGNTSLKQEILLLKIDKQFDQHSSSNNSDNEQDDEHNDGPSTSQKIILFNTDIYTYIYIYILNIIIIIINFFFYRRNNRSSYPMTVKFYHIQQK